MEQAEILVLVGELRARTRDLCALAARQAEEIARLQGEIATLKQQPARKRQKVTKQPVLPLE